MYDKMIEELQKLTHVEIFDTRPYLSENFPVDLDGNLNYRDFTHLSYRVHCSSLINTVFDTPTTLSARFGARVYSFGKKNPA